jgi:aldehyde oxidoreductase
MRLGLRPDGRLMLYNGAADIGQGSNTIMIQIAAEALGVSPDLFDYIMGDTDLTEDAGKTSASRQTFVSGKAAEIAARDLRAQILRRMNAGENSRLAIAGHTITAGNSSLDLTTLAPDERGDVLSGFGSFDPPTTPLDENGQGVPYSCYGFAAQMAEVEVDMRLGLVKVKRIVAAHDVGKAINPTLVEGQIHGGIAQGLGLALMEEYIPGKTENLHDYLIPTFGDMPEIVTILIEDAELLGPFGAKGIGEPALIPTAPAILSAIENATGARITRVPATPDRVLAASKARQ